MTSRSRRQVAGRGTTTWATLRWIARCRATAAADMAVRRHPSARRREARPSRGDDSIWASQTWTADRLTRRTRRGPTFPKRAQSGHHPSFLGEVRLNTDPGRVSGAERLISAVPHVRRGSGRSPNVVEATVRRRHLDYFSGGIEVVGAPRSSSPRVATGSGVGTHLPGGCREPGTVGADPEPVPHPTGECRRRAS